MRNTNSVTQRKDVGVLEFIGIVLLIPISFIVFNIIIGFMFRGFQQSSPESSYTMLVEAFYVSAAE